MAAYAALVSLMHVIDQIQLHRRLPISLDKSQVESLTENVTFLQEFLEGYSHVGYSKEAEALESRIADAANAAEDITESHIVDQILAGSVDKEEIINLFKVYISQLEEYKSKQMPHLICAALNFLMHIVELIHHHPFAPISLENSQVESFTEKVTFARDLFTGCYSYGRSTEAEALESRVADVACAAKDIVDTIVAGFTSHGEISSIEFYQGLQKVIEEMDFVKKEVMEIKEKMGVQDQLHISSSISAGSLRSASTGENITTVGFDDVFIKIMGMLTGGQPDRQIIPIVGMGGIGKSTLARKIFSNPLIDERFDVLAWATISQEYKMKEILLEILHCPKVLKLLPKGRVSLSQMDEYELGETLSLSQIDEYELGETLGLSQMDEYELGETSSLSQMDEDELGETSSLSQMEEYELGSTLYKILFGRRYLIIMDDIWDIEVWDQLNFFFPTEENGSRIIFTTRLSKLVGGSHGIELDFLDEDNSWTLFCKNAFREGHCPLGMEKIGKKIVEKCRGLPLSIIVIGGLLAKTPRTQQHWEYIAENLNSIINLEDNERCFRILHMSYSQLPIHLKPCFLYMGFFPEDSEIYVTKLIKLWVAEGFLQPNGGKSLEKIAEEYLKELIDRNLILVERRNSYGKIKLCKIHDLLRDLCLREAQKQKFFCLNILEGINTRRRIGIRKSMLDKYYPPQLLHALEPAASLARSLIWEYEEPLPSCSFRLLRVCPSVIKLLFLEEKTAYAGSLEDILNQVNWRFLSVDIDVDPHPRIPSSVSLLWNLQTLIVMGGSEPIIAPSEIWKMPLLRHVKVQLLVLPDPPNDNIVLQNLQTLSKVKDFKCGEEVIKGIPNIKKLKLHYEKLKEESPNCCLKNLGHLHGLESLGCYFNTEKRPSHLVQDLSFSHSLKKLTLEGTHLHWEDMTTMIGSLPLLEVLKLHKGSFEGPHWVTVEEQFCSLKFLLIDECYSLEHWTTESSHFPRLEHLLLINLKELKEIPPEIGEITTLKSIELRGCKKSAVQSAEKIRKDQEELNGEAAVQVKIVWVA